MLLPQQPGRSGVVNQDELRTERRKQIQFFAKQVFSRKGFHNTSVSDIIHEADIARGTFYLYFQSKRDIFDSLLDELLTELRRCIKPIDLGPGAPDPFDQLKANIRRVIELVRRDPQLIQILLHHAAGLDQKSAEIVRNFYAKVLELIERSLQQGIRLGLVRPCDTRIVASCILGTIKEVADDLTSQTWDVSSHERLVEEIIDFGLRGVLARPLSQ